jgi:hypothetical protein
LRDRVRKMRKIEATEASRDKRKMQRFSIALPSKIEAKTEGSAVTNCISRDVCACGGFFLTENPPPIGTQLMVQMFLQIDEPEKNDVTVSRISVWGTVIRTEKSGMGVRFDKRYKITYVRY